MWWQIYTAISINIQDWLALVEDFRTANWNEIIPYPQLAYQEITKYLS